MISLYRYNHDGEFVEAREAKIDELFADLEFVLFAKPKNGYSFNPKNSEITFNINGERRRYRKHITT